jgi:hypothetical protein
MLRLAGAAAAGAAVSAVARPLPAAAANGDSILIGTDGGATNSGTSLTGYNYTGATSTGVVWKFQDGTTWPASSASYPSVVGGWASSSGASRSGVYGYTQWADRAGVVGLGAATGALGGLFQGTRAALNLVSSGTVGSVVAAAHQAGDVIRTSDGDLWYVAANGTPGTLRKLAGAATAGAYHALAPGRVYDSRVPQPIQGAIANGQDRTISIKDKRNVDTGAVTLADFVPAGATAITANVTIVSQSGAGFLTVNPGGTTTVESSTINWSAGGQVAANGVTLTLDANRQLTVVCGGNGSTHFLLDVSGYYL